MPIFLFAVVGIKQKLMFKTLYDFAEYGNTFGGLLIGIIPLCFSFRAIINLLYDENNRYLDGKESKFYFNHDNPENITRVLVAVFSIILAIVVTFWASKDFIKIRNEYNFTAQNIVGKISDFQLIVTKKNKDKIEFFKIDKKKFVVSEQHTGFYFKDVGYLKNQDSVRIKFTEVDSLCHILKIEKYYKSITH